VSHTSIVAWLALRELWISFRLLLLLVAFVGAGTVATLSSTGVSATLERLALGLAFATALAGGLSAWSMAEERTTGRAGWLVARSVGRGSVIGGWLAAIGLTALGGLAAAAILGWMAISPFVPTLAPIGYVAAVAAVGAFCLAAIAAGMLLGTVVPAPVASPLTAVLVAASAAVAWALAGASELVPGAAIPMLARAAEAPMLVGPALRAGGLGLAIAAALVVVARALLDRVEL
jgi:hypothetical protein